MAALNDTPSGNRIHIGVFGRINSGKSSFINAFSGQDISITSDVAGTTTDPVYKAMEIYPLGACTLIDTAGFDDESALGNERIEKTKLAADKTDIAIIIFSGDDISEEMYWYNIFKEKNTPVVCIINKSDIKDVSEMKKKIFDETSETAISVSAKTGYGIESVKEALIRKLPEDFGSLTITGNLVKEDDLVLLVMPQDIQAPKGRLILPQVQTIRELLDKKCVVASVTTDKLKEALENLAKPPKLIITDSQVFPYVYENKPEESMLTSFSMLFAAYKGDIDYYVEGANAISSLNDSSHVLIAECCTHAPLAEDIGREKIPAMLRAKYGNNMTVDVVSGTDFPTDLSSYDLIIQCGGCMFNRKYVMSRIDRAKDARIPMTNYGVAIAYLSGILDKVAINGLKNGENV